MSNLLKDNKKLISEYNYKKNGEIDLNTITTGSHKKIWWKCSKGHEWESEVKSRNAGRGCPFCANKKVLVGYNDITTTNPILAKEWNYEKNENLKPTQFLANSHKKVWWKCKNGHEWISSIENRNKQSGCPYCSNRELITGYNDLATTNPILAKEWNYEKNNDLKPTGVVAGSNKKVWWKCSKGHEWEAIIKNRNNGQQCPYCTNTSLLVGYNDLATTHPKLAKEWNYKKNGNLKPNEIIAGSNKMIWWKCSKGHEWKTKALYRSFGQNCPYCTNVKVLKGYNDLATTYPELLKEWNYEKNKIKPSEIVSGSSIKVWWKCNKGHEWRAAVNSRSNGHRCPVCTEELKTSLPERTVYFYVKKYFDDAINNYHNEVLKSKELDIFIPSLNVGIEYDGQRYHKQEKDIIKDELCSKNNILLYRIREKDCEKYNSNSIKIYLENNDNDSLEKSIVKLLINLNIKKPLINIENDMEDIYNLINYLEKENSITKLNPSLAKEWHYEKNGDLKPDFFSVGSHRKVWWKCSKGHEWKAEIKSRNSGRKCPYCTNNKILVGYNDLATTNPDVAKEWDYEKNGDLKPTEVLPGSDRKVWWKCENGHEWVTHIKTRSRGSKCPYCFRKNDDYEQNNY